MDSSAATRVRIMTFVVLGVIASLTIGFSLGRMSAPDTAPEHSDAPAGDRATGTLIVDRPPTCDESHDRLTIVQDLVDGPMSAAWFEEEEQAVAQTFTARGAGLRLVEVAPTFDYALGQGAILSVHAITDPRDPMSGDELIRTQLDSLAIPSGQPARIKIDPPLALECGVVYSIVIRPARGSELGLQATSVSGSGNVYRFGAMFMGRPDRWDATGGDMRFEVVLNRISTG